jgi:uncharacterized protein (TIGR02246 family)
MKVTSLKSACLLIIVLFTASYAFSQTNEEYKAKIEKINKEMTKAMLAGDTEKNLSLYTTDAISMPSYEPMHEGIAAIRKASEEMMKTGWKCTSFEPKTLKVMANGNLITEIGTYKISMSMPGMEKPMDDHGKYLTIYEKQKDGSLKIKIETWNTDVNPMSMMGEMENKK